MNYILTLASCATLVASAAAQNPRDSVQLDDPLLNYTPDGSNGSGISLQTDGDLWVAMWTDERGASTSNDDVWMNLSLDGGHTWQGEFIAVDASSFSLDVDDPFLAVDNGTIYCSYDDYDSTQAISRAYVTWSTDNGATFTSLMYPGDVDNPRVYVDGDNLLVLAVDGGSTPNALLADWSSTGPAGLTGALTAISNVGADVDQLGYDADMKGSTAYLAWMDDFNFANTDDIWYTTLDVSTGTLGLYQQINSAGMDVDLFTSYDCITQVRVAGGRAHFTWHADAVPGAPSAFDDMVFYRNLDLGTGALGTEMNVTGLGEDTTFYHMDAQGDNVVIGFERHFVTGDQEPFVWASSDGGTTFTETDLDMVDESGANIKDVENIGVFADAGMMFMFALDDSMTAGSSWDRLPVFWWSNDNGATWSAPVEMGGPFQADEDADAQPRSYHATENGVAAVFQTDGGAANPDGMYFSGLDFPWCTLDNAGGMVTVTQGGNPSSDAGSFSRWAVSSTLGTQVHPENPALSVMLGASSEYTFTTNFPPIPILTGTVAADGSSTFSVPGTIPPGTYYVQAWTNSGSATGGTEAGEVFEITL